MLRATLLAAALAAVFAGSGCKVTYEPIYEDPPARLATDAGVPGAAERTSGPEEARRPIGYRKRVRVDWDGIGNALGGAAEAVGVALYVTGRVALEVAVAAASCCCKHQ
ncbi:MAG: hypothetical protein L0216_14100 [Planctomycetales bacterium]|nr:hypothetical protein [Planctomycetales bacterium]